MFFTKNILHKKPGVASDVLVIEDAPLVVNTPVVFGLVVQPLAPNSNMQVVALYPLHVRNKGSIKAGAHITVLVGELGRAHVPGRIHSLSSFRIAVERARHDRLPYSSFHQARQSLRP